MPKRKQRDFKREAHWRQLIEEQQQSGQSIRAFCQEKQISEPSFFSWRRELHKRDQQKQSTKASRPLSSQETTFIPITVTSPPTSEPEPSIEILLPNQITLKIQGAVDAQVLASTLAVLREQP